MNYVLSLSDYRKIMNELSEDTNVPRRAIACIYALIERLDDPCPRCAELEARLANFERETFADLRKKVAELEAIEKLARAVVTAKRDGLEGAVFDLHARLSESDHGQPSGYVYLPETADPTANPTVGSYHWIDQDGKAWIRTTDGNVYPHPLLKDNR